MPDYICSRGQKVFFQKCNYQHHLNRKFPCKIVGEKFQFKCEFCDKIYVRKYCLNRHLKSCDNKRMKDMEERIKKEMKEEIEKLKDKQLQIIQNNSNNNNNITNNVNIVAYGKEDIERLLTDRDFRSIMRRGMRSVPELVRRIHFDEKTPENHNVYISNLRGKYVLMHDGKKWRHVQLHSNCKYFEILTNITKTF